MGVASSGVTNSRPTTVTTYMHRPVTGVPMGWTVASPAASTTVQ